MKTKHILLFAIGLFTANAGFAQSWIDTWQQSMNFYVIQNAFNDKCQEEARNERKEKKVEKEDDDQGLFPGYVQFKRWETFVGPRVYPSGDISVLATTWKNYEEFLKTNSVARQSGNEQTTSSTWTAMGPFGPLTGNATNGLPRKAGRINFITFHPTDPNTFWIGAPAGGLWKTTDHGTTWSTNTDNLSVIGCTDLAIDPTNPNTMYLATGDGYFSQRNPSSIGVLKSIDGGLTWGTTGLIIPISPKVEMRKILVNPVNPSIVMAATSSGIYRNTNGGVGAWTNVQATNTYDIEFNPSNPDTVYAAGLRFRRSTDGGATWTQISAGIPTSGSQRMEIATTSANPNIVYVVSANNTNYGLQGIYRSTNAGTSFTAMATTPNLLGNDCFITTVGGQGWYDLALAASPLNQNEVVVGGLGVWTSTDGGTNWVSTGCGYTFSSSVPYVHTDHQELQYTTAGNLFSLNDGGVFEFTGTAWNDLTAPMNVAQIYKIGLSSISPNLWITGHQDNGSNIYNNGIYSASLAADGTDNFIDRTNDLTMYASIYQGQFYKSTNGGGVWNACTTGLPASSGFITPWKQDPQVPSTIYCGRAQMYKSINSAGTWAATVGVMSGVVAAEFVTEFAIAPSNNQYIYAIHGTTGVFTTSNAGATNWVLNNSGLPVASAAGTFITVNPTNPLEAWVTFSGYSSGNKIFQTINGGTTWQNISYNLPNIPANCSVYETGNVNGRIYVGMDVGVYYKDSLANTWTIYNTGLPNTPIMDMEISPATPTKITAATFGRGVYRVDLAPNPIPPVSSFTYSGTTCSIPDTLQFTDGSSNTPTSWSWSVNPSAGVTINTPTSQNPNIIFTAFGSYTVSLTPTNSFGTGNTSTQVINIVAPVVNATIAPAVICVGEAITLTGSGATTYLWQPGNLSGATVTLSPAASQTYTLSGTNSVGCVGTDTVSVNVSICTGLIPNLNGGFSYTVFPNPTQDNINVAISVDQGTDFELQVKDVSGKLLIQQSSHFDKDKSIQQVNISSLANGIYFLMIISKDGNSQPIKIIKQ